MTVTLECNALCNIAIQVCACSSYRSTQYESFSSSTSASQCEVLSLQALPRCSARAPMRSAASSVSASDSPSTPLKEFPCTPFLLTSR